MRKNEVQFIHLDRDQATQINADPDPKPCYCDQFYAVVLNFSLLRDVAYFVDDIGLSGDGESDVSDEEESESNDDSSQSGEEEEGESSEDDEVDRYLHVVFLIRSGLDPDSIRSGDPEPDSESGSRRSKSGLQIRIDLMRIRIQHFF
jgi:hypothetical protein